MDGRLGRRAMIKDIFQIYYIEKFRSILKFNDRCDNFYATINHHHYTHTHTHTHTYSINLYQRRLLHPSDIVL